MSISHLDTISIPVSNKNQSLKFYQEAVGFELLRDHRSSLMDRWIQLAPKGATTSISLVTPFAGMKAGAVQGLVVQTENIVTTHRDLKQRGVDITEISQLPHGRFATFVDPDGNGWVLIELGGCMTA